MKGHVDDMLENGSGLGIATSTWSRMMKVEMKSKERFEHSGYRMDITWHLMRAGGWRRTKTERSGSVPQWPQQLEADTIHMDLAERQSWIDPIEIHTANCHSLQRPLKLRQWMNTSLPNWASADSLCTSLHIPAASPVSCRACGTLWGPGRGRQKVFSGPCELLTGLQWRCSFNQIPSVLKKKKTNTKADFRFTLGFKIYYVFQLSSLHTWNSLLLITFYQHSSTTGGLTSKIALDD